MCSCVRMRAWVYAHGNQRPHSCGKLTVVIGALLSVIDADGTDGRERAAVAMMGMMMTMTLVPFLRYADVSSGYRGKRSIGIVTQGNWQLTQRVMADPATTAIPARCSIGPRSSEGLKSLGSHPTSTTRKAVSSTTGLYKLWTGSGFNSQTHPLSLLPFPTTVDCTPGYRSACKPAFTC